MADRSGEQTEATTTRPAAGGDQPDRPAAAAPGAGKPDETSVDARLDGMRGWLGDLDRTVGIRSRIGLVLAAIAIGASGAAIYLSLDAKQQSASNRDVSSLRDQLQQIGQQASDTAQDVTSLKSSVDAARRQAADASSTADSLRGQIKSLQTDVSDLQDSVSKAAAAPAAGAAGGGSSASNSPPSAGNEGATGGTKNP